MKLKPLKSSLALAMVLITGLIAGAMSSYAAPGSFDTSFGTGGKVVTSFLNNARPQDVALQSDGKLIVVGTFDDYAMATQTFGVVRYLPNGGLDHTFAGRGSVFIAFTDFINSANAVAIAPDGKILVAGEAQSANGSVDDFALARLNPDGSLDSGFGDAGKITTDFRGFRDAADVILLQPDGKIIVGGLASTGNDEAPEDSALARYNPDGKLDTTFGKGGKVAINAVGNINALALQADGHILALDGSAIASFDSHGASDPMLRPAVIVARAHTGISTFQSDGKFIVAGSVHGPGGPRDTDVKTVRFDPAGGVDGSFNSPIFDFGAEDRLPNLPQAIAVQPNGQISSQVDWPIPCMMATSSAWREIMSTGVWT